MSILKTTKPTPTRAAIITQKLKIEAAQQCEALVEHWERSHAAVWLENDPATILAELGTDAAELFEISTSTINYFEATLPGRRDIDMARIRAKVEAIPATTKHADGTVTLD